MPNLTDTQSILLAHAAQQDSGSFHPLPAALVDAGDRAAKALAQLTKRGLAEERETSDPAATHRTDGDLRCGLFITANGLEAIGVAPEAGDGAPQQAPTPPAPAAARQTKAATVLALLRRKQGATLAELIEATGWLPHTTRAALTGLRKKGHVLDKTKRGDVTCYRIVAAG